MSGYELKKCPICLELFVGSSNPIRRHVTHDYGMDNPHKLITAALGILSLLLVSVLFFMRVNKVSPLPWGWFGSINTTANGALDGFDPVALNRGEGLKKGDPILWIQWEQARWTFVSKKNRAAFEEAPDRFAPRFGGFCAFAVSKGFTAQAKPSAWLVQDEKLYLFADDGIKQKWLAEMPNGILQQAEGKWAKR